MFKKILSLNVIICFCLTTLGPLPNAHADAVLDLPVPGTMVNLSPAYEPVMIKGLTVHKDNPFLFDFIIDVGQDKISGEPLKKEGEKLIKYFLASLAIPDKDVWVNLSPYEKNRMIPEALGQTDMGRDLLEQDYILKQITASLIYPGKQIGKTFWDKVYAKAQQMYGTTQVPVNTFNKVWIMADQAEVFEHNQTAFVVDQHLKVMLEEDYLALSKHQGQPGDMFNKEQQKNVSPSTLPSELGLNAKATQGQPGHALASQIVRSVILPELEKEVNTGKNFANLRQIFNSIILSSWYKKNLKAALLNQVYANKSKVKGINLKDPTVKEQIYQQYLTAYKKGVFNYIKEDINLASGETIPRKYFSGGILGEGAASPAMLTVTINPAVGAQEMRRQRIYGVFKFETFTFTPKIVRPKSFSAAMTSDTATETKGSGFVIKKGMEVSFEGIRGSIINVVLPRPGSGGHCDISLDDGRIITPDYQSTERYLVDETLKTQAQSRHVNFSIDPRLEPDLSIWQAVDNHLKMLGRNLNDFMFFEISLGFMHIFTRSGEYSYLEPKRIGDVKNTIEFKGILRPDAAMIVQPMVEFENLPVNGVHKRELPLHQVQEMIRYLLKEIPPTALNNTKKRVVIVSYKQETPYLTDVLYALQSEVSKSFDLRPEKLEGLHQWTIEAKIGQMNLVEYFKHVLEGFLRNLDFQIAQIKAGSKAGFKRRAPCMH